LHEKTGEARGLGSGLAEAYQELQERVAAVPPEHLRVLAATDRLYACLQEEESTLTDAEYTQIKVLLAHAESLLTRYFGM